MLSEFLAKARPIELGQPPRQFYGLEMRPTDLADLEQIGRAILPDVLATLPREDADTPEHRIALCDALDAVEDGEPGWDSEQVRGAAIASDVGLLTILKAVLRPHPLADADLVALADTMTREQWEDVFRVAFGRDAAREVLRRIDRLIGAPEIACGGVSWVVACVEVCREFGWTPQQVGDLTLSQIALLRSGGKRRGIWDWDGDSATHEADLAWHQEVMPRRDAFFKSVGRGATSSEVAAPVGPCIDPTETGPPTADPCPSPDLADPPAPTHDPQS